MGEATIAREHLSLALLAGGRGSRLGGVEKGLLTLRGRTFAQLLFDELGPLVSATFIVTPRAEVWPGWDVAPDLVAGAGAPGALVTALCHAHTPWVLVVAVDLPRVTRAVVAPLLHAAVAEGGEGACYRRAGRAEGLLGVYSAHLGAQWRERLEENPSVKALIDAGPVATLDARTFGVGDALDSVNTPEALAAL